MLTNSSSLVASAAMTGLQRRSAEARSFRQTALADYLLATGLVAIITFLLSLVNHQVAHWFLLPVMACGVLAGVDIVRCARQRLDLFDPLTLVGFLAFYGFFVAPILHVIWDQYGVGNEMFLWGDWRT